MQKWIFLNTDHIYLFGKNSTDATLLRLNLKTNVDFMKLNTKSRLMCVIKLNIVQVGTALFDKNIAER